MSLWIFLSCSSRRESYFCFSLSMARCMNFMAKIPFGPSAMAASASRSVSSSSSSSSSSPSSSLFLFSSSLRIFFLSSSWMRICSWMARREPGSLMILARFPHREVAACLSVMRSLIRSYSFLSISCWYFSGSRTCSSSMVSCFRSLSRRISLRYFLLLILLRRLNFCSWYIMRARILAAWAVCSLTSSLLRLAVLKFTKFCTCCSWIPLLAKMSVMHFSRSFSGLKVEERVSEVCSRTSGRKRGNLRCSACWRRLTESPHLLVVSMELSRNITRRSRRLRVCLERGTMTGAFFSSFSR
mmetsp:Transcript_16759/g.27512  ORF Transcript_16759/g.27512 Transcript_16759/m.27512 type:complete len:299 (+) Transcript_16759:355-1251(+)